MYKNILYYRFQNLKNNENKKGPIKIIENKTNYISQNLNNSFSKEFTNLSEELYEEDDKKNILGQSFSYCKINKYIEEFLKEPLNIVLDSYFIERNDKKRKIKFITQKDISDLNKNLLFNKSTKNRENEEYLEIRNNIEDEKKFEKNFKTFLNKDNLEYLYKIVLNTNYRLNVLLKNNNISPLLTLENLFESIISNNQILPDSNFDLNSKYNKLKPIIYKYRQIKGDGNCYYRAVMFRYIEQIILKENIILLKKIIMDMRKCFDCQEIKNRLNIKMGITIKPEIFLWTMVLILNLMEKRKIKEAHQAFVKCILSSSTFDYGLILYFRYIIYLYIKENENKLFSKFFPIKIGNLLPSIYENEKGEFEFDKFYINYLLKMFMEAEKIIIYLTPFILSINLDIIIFEDNENQIVKRLSYEDTNLQNKNEDNVITLLNRNAHYELVYTYEEYNKYSIIYSFYEIIENNNNADKSSDNDFFLLQSNRKINNISEQKTDNSIKNINYNNTKNNNLNSNVRNMNNVINKDKNENSQNKIIKKNVSNNKPVMKIRMITETPFGNPESILDDNYLDKIDNMFSNKSNSCIICKLLITNSIQNKYNLCNKCLKNEIMIQLIKNYSDYLKNIGSYKNQFILTPIKINKYTLNLKDILDILKILMKIENENELINYLKKFVCIKCLKIIDNKKNNNIIFPCGCRICNIEELENYFTVQNEISENYQCICGYKYEPKDLYNLCVECDKIECSFLILLIINIFNKSILSKGCCVCGKSNQLDKIEYKPESKSFFCFENYLKKHDINYNLDHSMCKECKRRYKNQQFNCFYCNRIHLYIID